VAVRLVVMVHTLDSIAPSRKVSRRCCGTPWSGSTYAILVHSITRCRASERTDSTAAGRLSSLPSRSAIYYTERLRSYDATMPPAESESLRYVHWRQAHLREGFGDTIERRDVGIVVLT